MTNKQFDVKKFDVFLLSVGDKKINVIRKVMEVTKLDPNKAKELVEAVPVRILTDVPRAKADTISDFFEGTGAVTDLWPVPREAQPEGASKPEPVPVQVRDAADHAFDLACGIDDIFSAAACSDEGLSREAFRTLRLVSEKLVLHVGDVKSWLNKKEE